MEQATDIQQINIVLVFGVDGLHRYANVVPFERLEFEQAKVALTKLVDLFQINRNSLENPKDGYTETEARVEYIDRLLAIFGWDINNEQGLPQSQKEVALERTKNELDVKLGRPDYRLRHKGIDLLPIEAKKPAIKILESKESAIQARAYGWNLSIPAAVLTNFSSLAIYDTTVEPQDGDLSSDYRLPQLTLDCTEYIANFDILWKHLAFTEVTKQNYFTLYNYQYPVRGTSSFDKTFITQFRVWRIRIATTIHISNPSLGAQELGQITQRIMNALLFLRVCEDRDIFKYEDLLNSTKTQALIAEFRKADVIFNAGLFTVLGSVHISDTEFIGIVTEMYWPKTKFAFGIIDPEVLASLYEHYLYERINISSSGDITLVPKPELMHAGGVVPTPKYIVDKIIEESVMSQFESLVEPITVLDLACGSGIFLLRTFQKILDTLTDPTLNTLELRGKIASEFLFGIDIDPEAVEVTKLSLLLSVLGDDLIDVNAAKGVLPNLDENIICGNSLIDNRFDTLFSDIAKIPTRRAEVNPLVLSAKFQQIIDDGGFRCIIGNPPFVRIQVLQEFSPDQLAYFQDPSSKYKSSQSHNFDLYLLFLEKGLEYLSEAGMLGMIIPNRITNGLSAGHVRGELASRITNLIHFGEQQVFPGKSTYTALLFVGPTSDAPVNIDIVKSLDKWRLDNYFHRVRVPRASISSQVWPIASEEDEKVFQQMETSRKARLGDPDWAEIFVGVQTSADALFFINPVAFSLDRKLAYFTDIRGKAMVIETSITRPAIRDRKINQYDLNPEPDSLAIFPYELTVSQGAGGKTTARLLNTKEIATRYPLAHKYFEENKISFNRRSISPNPGLNFWAFGRSQSLGKMHDPKIIVRVLSLVPSYAVDTTGLVVPGGGDGGPYYLIRPAKNSSYSIEVYQAILSNEWVDKFIASRGRAYRGSYIVHRKAFLKEVPIPALSVSDQSLITSRVQEIGSIDLQLRSTNETKIKNSLQGRKSYLILSINTILEKAYNIHHP